MPEISACRHVRPHDDDSDEILVEHVVDRCEDSLAVLYARYATRCLSLARKIVRDRQRAEEVLQDVFTELWKNPGRFDRARGSLATWLLTITHRRSIDVVRRERRHQLARTPELLDEIPADGPAIDQQVIAGIDSERVRTALRSLREDSRRAIVLAYFGGYTQAEIAASTGTPLGTVKSRMRLGLATLREALAGEVLAPPAQRRRQAQGPVSPGR